MGVFGFGKFVKLDFFFFFISNPAVTHNLTALGCSVQQPLISENLGLGFYSKNSSNGLCHFAVAI